MGRKKIAITRLTDERNRQITFSKRKGGLLKKAYELSILCDVEIAVVMITSNNKLYQYASSNMNSILIRYTEFKDPDESKTNADILEDITRKERTGGADQDGKEEVEETLQGHQFLLTPHTQAHFRKIDEEFDHMLRHNQMQAMPAPLQSGGPVPQVPNAMPVSVPVTQSPSALHQQIQQHLQQQMEMRSASSASSSSSLLGPSSASPQSDLSSASPLASARMQLQKSPGSMPPPLSTPTRLQTLRNQTLKLHLPGSGRNYISLTPGGGGAGSDGMSPNKRGEQDGDGDGGDGVEEGAGGGGQGGGNKPQLRVYIPGQKEFVPRTQATSPLPQVGGLNVPGQQGGANQASTSSESLTTPILSLATPNLFSSLPPLFSSFTGEFPFGSSTGGSAAVGGGGGGMNDLHSAASALVAFPVSIQPSSVGSSTSGTGNIILQAQNMGQPFLLTPNYDPTRQNPLFSSQTPSFTPPSTLAGLSPSRKDLEQLKHQYEKVQQQLLQQQQQLFLSQTLQQQAKDGATGPPSSTVQTSISSRLPPPSLPVPSTQENSGLEGSQGAAADSQASQFSGVLMSSSTDTRHSPTQECNNYATSVSPQEDSGLEGSQGAAADSQASQFSGVLMSSCTDTRHSPTQEYNNYPTSISPRLPPPSLPAPSTQEDSGLEGSQGAAADSQTNQFAGVLMSSQSRTGINMEPPAPKRPRLQASAASSF